MTARAYFDWNATAPLRTEARDAMVAVLSVAGNASSIHGEGRAARAVIEKAREQVAAIVKAKAKDVIFTSGGTEANNLALTPTLEIPGQKNPRTALFVSAIEHPSVLAGGRFTDVARLPVTAGGVIDLDTARQLIANTERPLVSVMLANNETGVIQPIRALAEIVHAANGLLHVDAVQGAGKIPVSMQELGADLLTLSAHKIGGPQGAGALIKRENIHITQPLISGGGQERGQRAGTENVAAIAGFGAAAQAATSALAAENTRMVALLGALERGLRSISGDVLFFGAAEQRLPNTTLFAVPGLKAETAIIALDLAGIAVSSGSACSSGKVSQSHVLAAMGVAPEIAQGAIRASIGYATAEKDIQAFLNAWTKVLASLSRGDTAKREIAA